MPISTFPRHDYDEDEYLLKPAGLRDTHFEGKVTKCFGMKEDIPAVSTLLILVDLLCSDRYKIDYIQKSRRFSVRPAAMAHLCGTRITRRPERESRVADLEPSHSRRMPSEMSFNW